jgi:hypothetical protein
LILGTLGRHWLLKSCARPTLALERIRSEPRGRHHFGLDARAAPRVAEPHRVPGDLDLHTVLAYVANGVDVPKLNARLSRLM